MPIRTCLVTGQALEQDQLLRFTVQDGAIVFDPNAYFTSNSPEESVMIGSTVGQGRSGYVIKDQKALKKIPHMKGKINHFMKCKI